MTNTQAIERYLDDYSISCKQLDSRDVQAIEILLRVIEIFENAIDGVKTDVRQEPLGILILMLQNIHEYASSALSLALSGQYKAAEIVSRTVVESSINFMYILQEDTNVRIADYIAHYHYRELKELDRWEEIAKKNYEAIEQKIQLDEIVRKRTALEVSSNFFDPIAGIKFPTKNTTNKRHRTIGHKFKALGRESDYRTVYAALCSQVHNAPEDLINELLANVLGSDIFDQKIQDEQEDFAKILTFNGLGYYIESVVAFLYYTEMNGARLQVEECLKAIRQIYETASNIWLIERSGALGSGSGQEQL